MSSYVRWALVVPAAIIASLVAYIAVYILTDATWFLTGMTPPSESKVSFLIQYCTARVAMGTSGLAAAIYVAPTHKDLTWKVLTAALVALYLTLSAIEFPAVNEILAMIATVFGAIAARSIFDED